MVSPSNSSSNESNTTEGGSSEKELDAIIEADKVDKAREEKKLSSEKKKDRNKKVGLIGFLVAAFIAVVIGGFFAFDVIGGNSDGSGSNDRAKEGRLGFENGDNKKGNLEFWEREGLEFPREVAPKEEWQMQPSFFHDDVDAKGQKVKSIQKIVGERNMKNDMVRNSLTELPSRSMGFTDDINKVRLDDGTLNPLYSYWTAEGFNESVLFQLERFINPQFGNWISAQFPGRINKEGLINDFSSAYDNKYMESVKDKPLKSWLPIYADWDGNNYGINNFPPSPNRWMGKLENISIDFQFDNLNQTYEVRVTAHVKYMAWNKDQKSIRKDGVITFDVVTNESDDILGRYKLKNSKLEITK